MARINMKEQNTLTTHEGAPAKRINAEQQLRRSVMACLLWEDQFYEDGQSIADRITEGVANVSPEMARNIAIEARTNMKLRHVPLLIARAMAKLPTHRKVVPDTLNGIIQRADELSEFLAIYWKDKKEPLSAGVKKGLAKAFTKFNAYQLAKYNGDAKVKLRDVLFLCHAKPIDEAQAATWKQLIDGTLPIPDTWETAISATKGENKKEEWERLIAEGKLGGLAYLRNLRNMREAGISMPTIRAGLLKIDVSRVLPFRFITAAMYNPTLEPELETLMFKSVAERPKLRGETAIAVDCSGSMETKLSEKSQLSYNDAGIALAILLRELCQDGCDVYAYGDTTKAVPARRGFALRDAIKAANPGWSTRLGSCISTLNASGNYKRLLVITDEQSDDSVPDPRGTGYVINVAAARNGVGYGKWNHIDGWSEAIIDYIQQLEG